MISVTARPSVESSAVCRECGKAIPALPTDALCVRCRYGGDHKQFETAEDTPGEIALEHFDGTPPNPAEPLDVRIERVLLGCDVPITAITGELVNVLERLVESESTRVAAEKLMTIAHRLKGTVAGEALTRILAGDNGESLESAGKRCGKSKVAIHKAERRIRSRLTNQPLPIGALMPHKKT